MKKPYYITTAIAYASGKPHIGNTYEIVLADSIARFKRLQGYDVFFQKANLTVIDTKFSSSQEVKQEFINITATFNGNIGKFIAIAEGAL